jgi:phosphotriesterase-related protein
MKLNDERVMVQEIMDYRALGGGTIVDPAPPEIGRDPVGLQRIARLTGANIVCGTSHYVHPVHSPETASRSAAQVAREFVCEIEEGIGNTGVKAGIIGEIGNSWPWHENEKKCCKAAATAQRETGASITIHPGRDREAPMEILRLLKAEGADLNRVIMGHIENRIFEIRGLEKIMASGCYLEFDAFGVDHLPFGENPSDEDRVRLLAQLMRNGYTERILISQDICRKLQLKAYGGYGYGHILENIVPLLRNEEVGDEEIHQVLVENPAKVLTFE